MSDKEIKDMLNEIRLETAMAAELMATANVIKKTGIFDPVDRIYGDPDVMNKPTLGQPQQQQQGPGGIGGGAPGGDVGGALHMDSLGGPGDDTTGDVNGTEATTPMSQAPQMDAGIPLQETLRRRIGGAQQTPKLVKLSFMEQYFNMLNESRERAEEDYDEVDYIGKADIVNDGLKKSIEKLQKLSEEFNKRYTDEDEELISENEAFDEE